jgi:hypothetical protein
VLKKAVLLGYCLSGLCFLNGCSGGGSGGPPPPPAEATHFSVTAPAAATAGTSFNFTVTALDASNNTVVNYPGTALFTSMDAKALLPADSKLTNGVGSFSATLNSAGSQTITATDSLNKLITGTSNSITVSEVGAVNPVPLINQPLIPGATLPGGTGFELTVNGTGFSAGSSVKWNGSGRATSFVSSAKLTATVLASDVASFNTGWVTVDNPSPGGGTSNLVFLGITRPTSAVALGTPEALNAGSSPSYVTVGDFNGDGKLDLAIANLGSNDISVLLGNGDGTFQAAVNYGVGSGPRSIGVGDFNGDGKQDLAVVNVNSNNVSVLLGNGDGTFQPAVNYAAGSGGQSVAIGDFNGDGKLDLAVANNQSNDVSVLLGNGDGTFHAAVNYPAGAGASSVAVGDFNGDGNLDLAVANFATDNVSILLGNGDGTFRPAVNYAAGGGCQSVAAGDLNGDGKLDLAVANSATNDVSILLGNGDGTFQSAMNIGVGAQPESLVEGDFNGDGMLDLAVGNDGTGSVSILLGIGDGTFQPAELYNTGTVSQSLTAGDFNGDGRLDVAVAGGVSSTVSVLLQASLVAGPNATWSYPNLTFAKQTVGTVSTAQSITLVNYGSATLNITSITTSTNFGQTNTCSSSIAPGASCTVMVTFSPTMDGPLSGTLKVTDNAGGSPQTVVLTGTGVAGTCIPQGGSCFGPGLPDCCRAPFPHHSYCSNPTGWGTCVES